MARTARGAIAQPVKPARSQRDWTARTRGTVIDAIRYSHFVSLMKRALPIAAGAIVFAILVYAFLPRASERITLTAERTGLLKNDLTMIKPKLTGADDNGNPFVITADAAVQDPRDLHRAHMKKIEADMTLDNGGWLNANAEAGFFDMDTGMLKLSGGIAVYSDSGYELHTEMVDIDLKKGQFHGPGTVTGHGPFGTLRADRFDADRLKQKLHLNGHVHTTFSTHKAHGI
jgi:lipopolysaccharide export system protein LptC